jgi:hypothetical protein
MEISNTQYCNLFGYQWLEGSIRIDLDSAGRGVWADILALASISRRVGYVERSQGIPYTDDELADKFQVPLALVRKTITICTREGRLTKDDTGTYFITNWNKYQSIPLGSEIPTKPIYAKKEPMTTKQKTGMLRSLVNQKPNVAIDVLTHDFGHTVVDKNTGEEL